MWIYAAWAILFVGFFWGLYERVHGLLFLPWAYMCALVYAIQSGWFRRLETDDRYGTNDSDEDG